MNLIPIHSTLFLLLSCFKVEAWPSDPNKLASTGLWSQSENADPREAPNLQGQIHTHHWAKLEPIKGQYDWSEIDKVLLDITEKNLAIGFRIYTGQHAPHWLYEEGIPEVKLIEDVGTDTSYPYYPDEKYKEIYLNFITIFREHLETLPIFVQENLLYIQAMYGSTGDITPWHGTPIDPAYRNLTERSEEFVNYVKSTTTQFCNEYKDTDPNIILLLNKRDDLDDFYRETCPKHWQKQGMVTHGYQLNDEVEGEIEYMDEIRSYIDDFPIRVRGENAQDTTEDGWWQEALASNFMAHMAWMLHFGIDFHELSKPYINEDYLQPAFEFFNRHVTGKNTKFAAGGFCYLRKELDSSDIASYPEDQFGSAKQGNAERMILIAEVNSNDGAKQEDPAHGTGIPMNNRDADALNDVGWNIHKGNYHSNLYQINPENSVGKWRVGNGSEELFGRFARSIGTSDENNEMLFSLNSTIWGGLPLTVDRELIIRIAYFDEGFGTWALGYDGNRDSYSRRSALSDFRNVFDIEKTNSKKWKEASWTITDGYFAGRGKEGSDIWIESRDEEETIFGLIEIYDPYIEYNYREPRFQNINVESATYVDARKPDTVLEAPKQLYISSGKGEKISYFKFPSFEFQCDVGKTVLKLWTDKISGDELMVQSPLEPLDISNLSWNTRPELSEPLLSFSLEPDQIFTNVDVTELLSNDISILSEFAISTKGSLGSTHLRNKNFDTRLVVYCNDQSNLSN